MRSVGAVGLNDVSFCYTLGQDNSFVVVLQSREDFVGTTVKKANESHPLLFVILESHHITFQHIRTLLHHLG